MKEIKVFIEIPKFCTFKYELDKETNSLVLDRPLNQACPENYGFFPNTIEKDGDPLDCFIISSNPLLAGTFCKVKVIGAFLCEDQGVTDNKIICVLENDENSYEFNKVLDKISNYLKTYKKGFKVIYFISKEEEALKLLNDSKFDYHQYVVMGCSR